MKKIFNKKLLSAIAVLAISGSVAASAGVLSACKGGGDNGITYAAPDGEFTGNVYYVAPYGKAENDGSTASKAKDPSFLNDVETLAAGDTVYLVPGTYNWTPDWGANHTFKSKAIAITASGAPGKNISFINAALDERSGYTGKNNKVILDFSEMTFDGSNRGVQIYGDYIYWYGIDVCGAGDNGLYLGGSYNTIEYCEFYNNRDTGLQLGRQESAQSNINQWPSYNLIKNCTSHNNYDDETYGENADGFAAKLTIGYGNVFDGCIAYRNSDDGWDLYAKSDSGNIGCVIIYNCVAFENGYLEYTQAYNHSKLNYNTDYNEPVLNSFKTRDGDGNGFKLGGSVMEGDVKMYNCLAFQNRMHGVTDNSNPGYLMIEGVTSYDNSAAIDDNPSSDTFGKVVGIANHDTHGNIDVARQDYSYNTVKNVLSVKSSIAKSLSNDAYRGSVSDSLLNAGSKTNVVKGSIDANTKNVKGAKKNTSEVNALTAEDIFVKLPVVANGSSYTYNIDGAKDTDHAVSGRVHAKYRNADHSINMGDILAIKSGFDFSTYLGEGVSAGSYLNKTSWDQYTHFVDEGLLAGITSEVYATLLKAKETLTINTDATQVYQDFEVPTKLLDATIEWATDDDELIVIGRESEISVSRTEYITIGVTRPADEDKTAKLTATIFYRNSSIQKEFTLTIKKDNPTIGGLYVMVTENDEKYIDGGKIIMDAYRLYAEPELKVENGAYYNGTLLRESQYTVTTKYEYAASASSPYTEVNALMVNHPGVYKITHTVKLNGSTDTASMSYQIFVASAFAKVDIQHSVTTGSGSGAVTTIEEGAAVSVYRDGYIIAGDPTSATGTLYTVASPTALSDINIGNIKTYTGVEHNDFRATTISFTYANPNNAGYHIYYALTNANGDVTSKLYHVEITSKNISSTSDFTKIAGGSKLGSEEVSQTIYLLTQDLDFNGTYSAGSGAFSGLLNGQGHTISNITISANGNAGLFSQVKGGTIENIKFNNIKITSSGSRAGIIARSYGGYYHNIAITNLKVTGSERVGGLIGQVFEGGTPTEVSQVSLINPMPEYDASTGILANGTDTAGYYIYGSGNRVAGIIAFIQTNNPISNNLTISVSDCYVETYLFTSGSAVSSVVGQFDENGQVPIAKLNGYDFSLEINNSVSAGVLVNIGSGRIGGMIAYHAGSGSLHISGCLAIHKAYYKQELLEVAQKNNSGIVGNFSTADGVDVQVGRCISYMEEYNTDYDVTMYTQVQLSIPMAYANAQFDTTTKWQFVYKAGSTTTLERPYLQLNFLGEWNAD